ncbi:MAG: hypothetical protein DI589_13800 [Shinella sp.]|nr:MAG: hypothetical protein DI589_13800 [Shinella sp.]
MWRLFVPLKYLLIRHPEKAKFDVVFPIFFACAFLLPTLSADFRQAAVTSIDLLGRSSDLLSILTGFFVAALAAVATFGGDEMNETMPGHPPVTLPDPIRPGEPEKLSRRRFLSFLFGYLAFLSLALYLVGFVYFGLQTYVIAKYAPDWVTFSFVVFWGIYGVALGNLLANTLLGLFYLTDRIHRPNKKIYSNKVSEADQIKSEKELV